jgi:1,4-alpha-glucan branching enzyme
MITKLPCGSGKVKVTFALPAALWADTIYVVGDFNGWDERATPLRQTESGWMVSIELEAGRVYQYRYLVNGNEWHNDWQADGYEPNEYGGDNSVVVTPAFEYHLHKASERIVPFTRPWLRLVPTG